MASRFWVGGGSANTWAAVGNTNWGSASGVLDNASVPGVGDAVFFDNNSGVGNSVISANITIQNLDCGTGGTAYAGTLTHNTSVTLTCNTGGTFRFSSGMTYTPASTSSIVTFTHTSGTMTLTSAGQRFAMLTINGASGTTTLADALRVDVVTNSTLTLTTGTLDAGTNTAAITAYILVYSGASARALTLGGTVTLGGAVGSNTNIWNAAAGGLTLTKNSANVVIVPPTTVIAGYTISPGVLTYNNLTLNDSSAFVTLQCSNSFVLANLAIGKGWGIGITNAITVTNPFSVTSATPLLPCFIYSLASAATQTITITNAGTMTLNWCFVYLVNFLGAATVSLRNSFGTSTGATITPPGMGPTTQPVPQRALKAGATSQSVDIFIQDSSSLGGAGLTGLVFNSSGLTAYYRNGQTGTSTSITLATQTVGGLYSSGGLIEIDSTNQPGKYRFDIPDTLIAATGFASIYFQGAANMVPCIVPLQVVAYDPTDAVRLGLTALPNAAAAANGGLPTVDATNSVAITSNIKKNTGKPGFMFVMRDSTTHNPVTGLTVTSTRSIDKSVFAATTNAVSEVANGVYGIDLSAADMNGNNIMLRFTASGADDLDVEIVSQP